MGRKGKLSVMARAVETSQLVKWLFQRYFRFIFLGAMSSCAFFNLALHSSSGLHYYCESECLDSFVKRPLSSLDKDIIAYIKDNYVDPPHPRGSYKGNFPLENPPWGILGKWGESHEFLMKYFTPYDNNKPGKFVEIGAQDGEFMSFTLWLEQKKNFEGLLVEPNPVDYPKLRATKRSSYSVNACASPMQSHHKDVLWLRDIPSNLPPLLKRIQEGSNRLLKYVASEDRELGSEVRVQCFNIGALMYAALNTLVIDFVSISTHGGELDIFASFPTRVQIRVLVIVAPLASDSEYTDLKKMAKDRGLVEVHVKGNIHTFIPENEVKLSA